MISLVWEALVNKFGDILDDFNYEGTLARLMEDFVRHIWKGII